VKDKVLNFLFLGPPLRNERATLNTKSKQKYGPRVYLPETYKASAHFAMKETEFVVSLLSYSVVRLYMGAAVVVCFFHKSRNWGCNGHPIQKMSACSRHLNTPPAKNVLPC
jgi:hypothetical protein